jgi:hypothetical protein
MIRPMRPGWLVVVFGALGACGQLSEVAASKGDAAGAKDAASDGDASRDATKPAAPDAGTDGFVFVGHDASSTLDAPALFDTGRFHTDADGSQPLTLDAGSDAPRGMDGGTLDALGFLGPPDAEWLVDAPVDAASCGSIAAALCARIAACPLRAGFTQLCFEDGVTTCVQSYADCVGFFSLCRPTTMPPVNKLTLIPNPAECAAALATNHCVVMGQDHDYELPTSCGVCPPPIQGPGACLPNVGDAGDGGG